jgi:flagellar motor switch protein FliN/FliY
MTTATTEILLARAGAAAEAAVALLPVSGPLSVGTPTRSTDEVAVAGQAVLAKFSGTARGQIAVVVGQDLVDALANTPMGNLDLTQAVRPALEAAAATLGPVVVDPGTVSEPAAALSAVVDAGGVLVPLLDGGTTAAVIALSIAGQVSGGTATPSATRSSANGRVGLDLLHDVEMEVTAELGRTRMNVRELLALIPGAVIELDRAAGGPADLLVNGRIIARGEVVVVDENFGIRITEILSPSDRA